MSHCECERSRVRLEGLDDHFPGSIPAAATGELRDELERPFLGPEVWKRKARVGVDDGSDRNARKVVPFRNHLRPDEHDGPCCGKLLERLPKRARACGSVGVEPYAFEPWNALLELGLESLCARADASELD